MPEGPRPKARAIQLAVAALIVAGIPAITSVKANAARHRDAGRYIVRAKSADDLKAVKADLVAAGAKITDDLDSINAVAIDASSTVATSLQTNAHVQTLAKSGVRTLIQPDGEHKERGLDKIKAALADPASKLPGLMWNLDRISAPQANRISMGKPDVIVAVADTGLDFTHSELKNRIVGQQDFTEPLCQPFFGFSDADVAAIFGGPANTDWNGHGSWIGGNIGAALDGVGINGIDPKIGLFDLKISEWCGSAFDSSILNAFQYAGDHGIDVVSISFGGFLDRADPDQDAIYNMYVDTVREARAKGTLIVAAAGNEHVRVGAGGRVLSHGQLNLPGDDLVDLFGQWEVPGGIPGVVDVSSTNNITVAGSPTCATGTFETGFATCKPASDTHQPIAAGAKDQLTYYSNYGPRIDIAGPGGARKFNLPNADRGGTPGFPFTTVDGTTAFEDFSITSNWALQIPCVTFSNSLPLFYPDECYSSIQGTSMATPHVSAVAGLIASTDKEARHHPSEILDRLREGARRAHNFTPALSATDTSAGDRTGLDCPTGYCHLGGPAIGDREAYGAGVVNAFRSIED